MLTKNEFAEFEAQGFLVFDPGLPVATVDEAVASTQSLYLDPSLPPDTSGNPIAYRDSRRLQDAWRASPSVLAIAQSAGVLERLGQLYRRAPMPFQTLNFRVGSEQRAHSDTIHFNSMPSGYMCGVWVALEDIDMDNGPVVYYPGSHKLPELTMSGVLGTAEQAPTELAYWLSRLARKSPTQFQPDPKDYLRYEDCIADIIRRSGIAPHYATIRKGQAFLWAANLLHGGSTQADRQRTRHSQVTHYFFEGCRYYTPLHTRGRQVAWRQPERIR